MPLAERLLEIWFYRILPVIGVIALIGYIYGTIMWKLGKWTIVFKTKEGGSNATKRSDTQA
jgi:hypothetical protein